MLLALTAIAGGVEPFVEDRLEKEVLVNGPAGGMEMSVLLYGRILVADRFGGLKLYNPNDNRVVKLGGVPAIIFREVGLGMTAAPDFAQSGWIYVLYCPKADSRIAGRSAPRTRSQKCSAKRGEVQWLLRFFEQQCFFASSQSGAPFSFQSWPS
jgi:hypothetical protein